MNIKRGYLWKVLHTLSAFDPGGAPYVGMQTTVDDVRFLRSSPAGYIHSLGYDPAITPTVVSLQHFIEVLDVLREEQINIGLDNNGIVRLTASGEGWTNDLRVHTLRNGTPWSILHKVGGEITAVEPTAFVGIAVGKFRLASSPLLKNGKLMLATDAGVVVRSGVLATAYPHPRESFLKAIQGLEVGHIGLTSGGYWGAVGGGFQLFVCGHTCGENMFAVYDTPGDSVADLPAARLLNTLDAAGKLCGDGQRIEINPKTGITTQDKFGSPGTFSLGEAGCWKPVAIPKATAVTIVEALKQSSDEVAVLSTTPVGYRLTRGLWAVNFKSY